MTNEQTTEAKEEMSWGLAVGTIEAGLFMLSKFLEEKDIRTPVEKAIDDATGFSSYITQKDKKWVRQCLVDIREAKLFLGHDVTSLDNLLNNHF